MISSFVFTVFGTAGYFPHLLTQLMIYYKTHQNRAFFS